MTPEAEEEALKTLVAANELLGKLALVIEDSSPSCEVLSVALGKLLAAGITHHIANERAANEVLDGIAELAETYIGQVYAPRPAGEPVQ